ncbi:hypothetical protein T11_2775 [Trichinella zimbabwensis]|uniref:Uncharacterized protein n=1 Tax=Trichinella zimbabwensis TaxID=268475 RepID=A0A0V1G117_9BILA|nr:hypothetical protein T11_2775 [Trichinella zimbabwensis]
MVKFSEKSFFVLFRLTQARSGLPTHDIGHPRSIFGKTS